LASSSTIVAVDFFCGAGGMTRGLLDAGIAVLCGIDNDVSAKETYEKNNNVKFIRRDIRWLRTAELTKYITEKHKRKLLFVACSPCQPFSKINRHRKKSSRQRSLLLELTRFVHHYQPEFILCENVPGIIKPRYRKVFRTFCRRLKRSGYKFQFKIIDAKAFGVPQSRKRMFLLAAKGSDIGFPESDPKHPVATVRDAIGHFPRIRAGQTHRQVPNHQAANLSDLNLKRIALTSKNGGGRERWPSHLFLPCHQSHSGHTDVYGRMKWNAPSPPITTRCISYSNGRFGHPSQNRAITPREAAAIQTFPDKYVFRSCNTIAALHIGNAVPVSLARLFGKYIIEAEGTDGRHL